MDVQSVKKTRTKEVQIGELTFKIRTVPPRLFPILMKIFDEYPELAMNPEKANKTKVAEAATRIADLLLPECVIQPKLVKGYSETELSIDDLLIDEQMKLVTEIFVLSGLTPEKIEQLSYFRQAPNQ